MKKNACLLILFLINFTLPAQDDVTIGRYRKFQSQVLGGEVTYFVHLPDGYDKSGIDYPVIYMMNGQSVSSFANAASRLENQRINNQSTEINLGKDYRE